jgi:hypothetical protein
MQADQFGAVSQLGPGGGGALGEDGFEVVLGTCPHVAGEGHGCGPRQCRQLPGADRHLRARCRPQAAGPVVRTTVAVCDWPDWSVQLMLTLLPGW